MSTGMRGVVCLCAFTVSVFAQTPQLSKEYIRLGGRIIAIENAVPAVAITTSSLPNGTVGSSYSTTLAATNGTTPYTWSIVSGTLPPGLLLNTGSGAITGTPSAVGTSNLTFQVQDAAAKTASVALSITIQGVSITTTSLPNGTVGGSYSTTLTATGGTTPYTWSVTPALPNGLSLNTSNGVISGTPTAAATGNYTFSVTGTTGGSATATLSLTIQSAALAITNASLPVGTAGVGYWGVLSAAGGTGPYTWSITSGTLPNGLSFNGSTGVITGVPTAASNTSLTFQVQATAGGTTSATLNLLVQAYGPILPVTNPGFETGNLNGWTFEKIGPTGYSAWTLQNDVHSGSWAGQIGINWGDSIPANSGGYANLRNQSIIPCESGQTYQVSYWANVSVTGMPSTAPTGAWFFADVTFSDGSTQRVFPAAGGISTTTGSYQQVTSTFTIPYVAGKLAQSFTYAVYLEVDNNSSSPLAISANSNSWVHFDDIQLYRLEAIAIQNPGFETGNLNGWTFEQVGQAGYTAWTQNTDVHSGSYTAQIGNNWGSTIPANSGGYADLRNQSVIQCQSGEQYSMSFWTHVAVDGYPPNVPTGVWFFADVTFSDGSVQRVFPSTGTGAIHASTNGYQQVNGTFTIPTVSGKTAQSFTYAVYLEVDNNTSSPVPINGNASASWAHFDDIQISRTGSDSSSVSQTVPSTVTAGQTFQATVSIQNTGSNIWNAIGVDPFYPYHLGSQNPQDNNTWGLLRVNLPSSSIAPGQTATFNFTATAPTTPGTYAFSWAMVRDYIHWFGATTNSTITVVGQLAVTTTSLPGGTVTWPYSQTLSAGGGTGPYTWALASGSLPAGLTLSSAGVISGRLTTAGTSTFTVTVTDSASHTATSGTLTIAVQATGTDGSIFVSQSALSTVSPGQTFTASVTMKNSGTSTWINNTLDSTYPYRLGPQNPQDTNRWSVGRVEMPVSQVTPGSSVTFNFTATAPTTPGSYAFSWAMLHEGYQWFGATSNTTIVVGSPLAIATTSLPGGTVNTPYSASLGATGGVTPYTWSVVSGGLPPGLSLSSSGAITGTPTTQGTASFTVKVTDASSVTQSATASLSIAIAAGTVSLSSTSASVNASAGQGTFTVTSNTNWSVTSDAGWLTATPAGGSSGTTTVTYSFTTNTTGAARVGHVNISAGGASGQFTLSQDKRHGYTISPSNINLYYAEVQQFQISIDGGAPAVNSSAVAWSISNVSDGGSGGSISNAGYYTAPNRGDGTHPVVTITALPTDGSPAATATVNVTWFPTPAAASMVSGNGGGSGSQFLFRVLSPNGGAVPGPPQNTQFLFNTGGTGNTAGQCYLNYLWASSIGINTGAGTWLYPPGSLPLNTPNPPFAIANSQCMLLSAASYAKFYQYANNNGQGVYVEDANLDTIFASADSGQYQVYVMANWPGYGTPQWTQVGNYTPSSGQAPAAAIDTLGTLSGTATITGWAIDNTLAVVGSVTEIDAYLDGKLFASTSSQASSNPITRVARTAGQYDPCPLYPGRADCPNSGYTFNWNTSSITGTTSHTLLVVVWGSGPQGAYLQTTVTVHN